MNKKLIFSSGVLALSLALTGCAGGVATDSPNPTSGQKPAATTPDVPKSYNLDGAWKAPEGGPKQTAVIKDGVITINWETEDTKALYWAGSFPTSVSPDQLKFESNNDVTQTENAILASSDPTKEFTYDPAKGTISYSTSALGVTTTVHLSKVGS